MERALRVGGGALLFAAALFGGRELRRDSATAERERLRRWYLARRDAAAWSVERADDTDDDLSDADAIRVHLERLAAYAMPLVIPHDDVDMPPTLSAAEGATSIERAQARNSLT